MTLVLGVAVQTWFLIAAVATFGLWCLWAPRLERLDKERKKKIEDLRKAGKLGLDFPKNFESIQGEGFIGLIVVLLLAWLVVSWFIDPASPPGPRIGDEPYNVWNYSRP
jgi:hypothetical protein